MKVLLVASSKAELAPFPSEACGHDFVKCVCGVGPVLAAASAAAAIAANHPDAVFSVGSAGSYGTLRVGDAVSFGSVVSPDNDLTAFHMKRGAALLPSGATLSSVTLDRNSAYLLSSSGTFASLPHSPFIDSVPDAADMEAYGVAAASLLAAVPCRAVKIITDIIGDGMKLSEYGFRLRELRKRLPEKVLEVLSAF